MPPSYDPDTQKWVRDTLAWYLNHHVFIHDDCQQLQSGGMNLNVKIRGDLPLNNRVIPDELKDTDESYNLYVVSA